MFGAAKSHSPSRLRRGHLLAGRRGRFSVYSLRCSLSAPSLRGGVCFEGGGLGGLPGLTSDRDERCSGFQGVPDVLDSSSIIICHKPTSFGRSRPGKWPICRRSAPVEVAEPGIRAEPDCRGRTLPLCCRGVAAICHSSRRSSAGAEIRGYQLLTTFPQTRFDPRSRPGRPRRPGPVTPSPAKRPSICARAPAERESPALATPSRPRPDRTLGDSRVPTAASVRSRWNSAAVGMRRAIPDSAPTRVAPRLLRVAPLAARATPWLRWGF